VGDKIFGGLGEHDDGKVSIGFKLEMEHADALVASDPRFTRAKYVGHKGWVDMDVSAVDDWDEVRTLVGESYRLIAPKRSLAKLGATASLSTARRAPAPSKKLAEKKATAKSAPAKKLPAKETSAGKTSARRTSAKIDEPVKKRSTVARSRAKKTAGKSAQGHAH
jgi:predicted DNA-binding protein (MmcQ/YjbR family)